MNAELHYWKMSNMTAPPKQNLQNFKKTNVQQPIKNRLQQHSLTYLCFHIHSNLQGIHLSTVIPTIILGDTQFLESTVGQNNKSEKTAPST